MKRHHRNLKPVQSLISILILLAVVLPSAPVSASVALSPASSTLTQTLALDPTSLSVRILSSPYAIQDSTPQAGKAIPQVFVVEAEVTNTGSATAANVDLVLDYNEDPLNNWVLLAGEVPQRSFEQLAPGESETAYWFARYPTTVAASHQYTVTASADNADPVSTWHNDFGDPVAGKTVATLTALSTGNSALTHYDTTVVVGAESTITVKYDLGTNPEDLIFSPVGNLDFSPIAFRLASSSVRFYNDAGTQEETFTDQLFFPSVASFAQNAEVTFVFIALAPTSVLLCPYAGISYGTTTKYDKDFCKSMGRISIDAQISFNLDKSADRANLLQGEVLTYTISYENTGNLAMKYVWIWDPIDPTFGSVRLDSIDPAAGVATPDLVGWYLNDIPAAGEPGSSGQLTFAIQVDGNGQDLDDGAQLINQAFVGVTEAVLPSTPAMTATATTTVQAPAVSITKSDGVTSAEPGDTLSYVLQVENTGSVAATDLVLTDVLPEYLTALSGDPAWDQQDGQTLSWSSLGPLEPGGSLQVMLDAVLDMKAPNEQVLTNTASVEYQNASGYLYTAQSAADNTTVYAPVLTIQKQANPDPVLTGETLTYTLSYANVGLATADNLVISDVLPESTSFLSCTDDCVFENGEVRWELASLANGAEGSVKFMVQVSDSLQTGATILNADYGISSDQTDIVTGTAVETTAIRPASIVDGYAFEDSNGNGVMDEGEIGLPGVTVTLPNAIVPVTTTGSDGYYRFQVEVAGQTSLSTDLPAGYFRTTPGNVPLQVVLQTDQTVNFGFASESSPFGVIYGTVFADVDGDGVFGPTEAGIPGVTVASDQAFSQTVSTNSLGQYTLRFDTAGEVNIVETNLSDYVSTTPDSLQRTVQLGSSSSSPADFGDFKGIKVEGLVFEDSNGNGSQDAGESGIPGVTVTLDADSQTLTGEDGTYRFLVEAAGNHRVVETDPDGYFSTTPNEIHLLAVMGNAYQVNFGDASSDSDFASVYGTVFDDKDKNALYGEDEVGISGVTITLDGGDTVVTGPYGSFTYAFKEAGLHIVMETDPVGYASSTPNEVQVTTELGHGYQADFGDFLSADLTTCSPDSYEEDDTYQQANPLQIGLTFRQEHNFCDDASDWLSLDVAAGNTYTITTSSWGLRADTYVALYDQDGVSMLAANDDREENEDLSSDLVWKAPASGRYYLEVTNRAAQTAGATEYDVWVVEETGPSMLYLPLVFRSTPPAVAAASPLAQPVSPLGVINHYCPDSYEVDDTWEQAQQIVPGVDQLHSFDSNPLLYTADKDVVWFEAKRGDKLNFSTTEDDKVLPFLELFDELGNALNVSGASNLAWEAPQSGRYYLSVSPQTNAFGCVNVAGYSLRMESTPLSMLYLPLLEVSR